MATWIQRADTWWPPRSRGGFLTYRWQCHNCMMSRGNLMAKGFGCSQLAEVVLARFCVSCYRIVKGGAKVELKLRYYLVLAWDMWLTSVMDIGQDQVTYWQTCKTSSMAAKKQTWDCSATLLHHPVVLHRMYFSVDKCICCNMCSVHFLVQVM